MSRSILVHKGSAKDKRRGKGKRLLFVFKDAVSAFDRGICPQGIPGKAEAVCAAAVQSAKIAAMVGVPTCFVRQVNNVTIEVVEAQPITDRPLTPQDTDCIVPAEWIDRIRVSGSFLRDFRSGDRKPTDYGFPTDDVPPEGTPFPWPVNHFTTKWAKTDENITHTQARALCGLTEADEAEFWTMISRLNGGVDFAMALAGYVRLDGKKECLLLGPNRQKVIGDVWGTQDEDRPVQLAALGQGRVDHYSKEFFRQYLIECGWYAELNAARAAGQPDPPYPTIPNSVIKEMSRRYKAFARAYASVDLRKMWFALRG